MLQSNIRESSELQENASIHLPIDFKLRNTETDEVVWEYDLGSIEPPNTIVVNNPESLEIFVPELSAGDYEFEWVLSDLTDTYNSIHPGQILESSYIVKVSDTDDLHNDADVVTQTISIDIQANSSPIIVDPDSPGQD